MYVLKASPGLDQRNLVARLLGPEHTVVDFDGSRPLREQVAEAEVLLIRDVPVDAAVIDAAPQLKLIQRPGDHITGVDMAKAAERAIYVSRFPSRLQGKPARDVAEHGFFLLLAVAKRHRQAQHMLLARKVGLPKTVRLADKTLALVGVGKTGAEMAKIARGFDMRVIAVKQTPDPALAQELGLDFLGDTSALHRVLGEADFVSVHLPNAPETANFLDRAEFAAMKPGAILVNIARAPMINKAAMADALASGQLGGAGLDVWWGEPADPQDPLLALDNVIVSPHIAGDTAETEARLAELTAENIRLLSTGRIPHCVVGRDVEFG